MTTLGSSIEYYLESLNEIYDKTRLLSPIRSITSNHDIIESWRELFLLMDVSSHMLDFFRRLEELYAIADRETLLEVSTTYSTASDDYLNHKFGLDEIIASYYVLLPPP